MMNNYKNLYIGIIGRNNSGKGTVSAYIQQNYGFIGAPLSDAIKEVAQQQGHFPPYDRKYLIDLGRKIKNEKGEAALLSLSLMKYRRQNKNKSEHFIFEGIRTYAEADAFLHLNSESTKIILLSLSTGKNTLEEDQLIRYHRALKRRSDKDAKKDTPEAFALFKKLDIDEGIEISKGMILADYTIINEDNNFISAQKQIDQIVRQYL